jgi:hypothetical protein
MKLNSNPFKINSKTSLYQSTQKRKIPHNSTDDVSMNILLFENRSLIVIQLMGEVELNEIQSDANFSKIFDTHFLYKNNQKLLERSKLKKGNHFIRYYSKLNGGGKYLEQFKVNNVFEIKDIILECFAENVSNLVLKHYMETNKDGITSFDEMEEWNPDTLFIKTYSIERDYLLFLEKEEFIGNAAEFAWTIAETIDILKVITEKMMMYFDNLDTHKQEYLEDSDDPPIPRIGEALYFVKRENYMTQKGLINFDLDYMLYRINFNDRYAPYNWSQKALEETPEIPENEYIWYFCPLEPHTVDIQIAYYIHWKYYDENDKVSKKEMSDIIKKGLYNSAKDIYDLIIKYNLTDADFIWDVFGTAFSQVRNKFDLFKKFKEPPFNINLPPDNRDTLKRIKELEKRGLTNPLNC